MVVVAKADEAQSLSVGNGECLGIDFQVLAHVIPEVSEEDVDGAGKEGNKESPELIENQQDEVALGGIVGELDEVLELHGSFCGASNHCNGNDHGQSLGHHSYLTKI